MTGIKTKYWIYLLKFFGWTILIGISFLWSATTGSENVDSFRVVLFLINLIPLLLIYTVNNIFFIPELLFKDKKWWFIIANLLFICLLLICSLLFDEREIAQAMINDGIKRPFRRRDSLDFIMRDLINFVLMIGFVTSLKLMGRLQASEEALKEAENARIKVELDNLKSQINPHFLLNTLNNIYALTAINPEQAQNTIQQLSKLLRYVLYENKGSKVLLINEVNFLNNYIELMRIRQSSNVKLTVNFDIEENNTTTIAPLLFISLIENAFKHGVSADKPSFIDINMSIDEQKHEITLSITNSNNAKNDTDKSGKGIGLKQVKKRLELLYSNNYTWNIKQDKDVYHSILTLKTSD